MESRFDYYTGRLRHIQRLWYTKQKKFQNSEFAPSKEAIDIIIPTIAPDLTVFPVCLDAIKKNVTNRIKKIYIVAPENEQVLSFCRNYNLEFVNENDVLGYGAKDINYKMSDGRNRSGWLFQQLLKLSGKIGECENFVTIDSDHILLKPHTFLTNDEKFVLYISNEFHWEYYRMNKRLTGRMNLLPYSLIAHKMIFNKTRIAELKKMIESHTGLAWDQAIRNLITPDDVSAFSEFELYGQSISENERHLVFWNEIERNQKEIAPLKELQEKYSGRLSVTFSKYHYW